MRKTVAKKIRSAAEVQTIGKPLVATKRLYRQMKKKYLHEKRYGK